MVQQRSAVMEESTQPVRSDTIWIMELFKQQQLLEQQRWDQQQQQEHLELMECLWLEEQVAGSFISGFVAYQIGWGGGGGVGERESYESGTYPFTYLSREHLLIPH